MGDLEGLRSKEWGPGDSRAWGWGCSSCAGGGSRGQHAC